MIARWNKSRDMGEVRCTNTEPPPAELSENRHSVRIAAKRRDVALNPPQRGSLVHIAIVAAHIVRRLGRQRRMRKEAAPPHPIIHADDDDPLARERVRRVQRRLPVHQRGTMDPHHDGERPGSGSGAPNIERQAILRLRYFVRLHTFRTKSVGRPHVWPRCHRLRQAPAQVVDWRSGVGNALEADHVCCCHAAHGAGFGLGQHRIVRCGLGNCDADAHEHRAETIE